MIGLMDLYNHTTWLRTCDGNDGSLRSTRNGAGHFRFWFSDHSHWMLHGNEPRLMHAEELEEYIADVRRLQEKFNRHGERPFHIRLGMEMDFMPSRIGLAREIQRLHQWDYIIDLHNIGFENFSSPRYITSGALKTFASCISTRLE